MTHRPPRPLTLRRVPRLALAAAAFAAATAAAGCRTDYDQRGYFRPETEQRRTAAVFDAQAAAGARNDATLRPMHFTAGALNGLGRQKLDRIADASAPGEVVAVYLDLPADAPTAANAYDADRAAAEVYLTSLDLPQRRFEVRRGSNPATSRPAIEGINRLSKTESSVPTAGPPSAGTYGPTASPGGGVLFGK